MSHFEEELAILRLFGITPSDPLSDLRDIAVRSFIADTAGPAQRAARKALLNWSLRETNPSIYRSLLGLKFEREFEMRRPVAKWLLSQNLKPILECASLNNCDIVGTGWDKSRLVRMVAIELKLTDIGGVFKQCSKIQRYANETYAAMPQAAIPDAVPLFINSSIGLLMVAEDGEVITVLPSKVFDRDLKRWNNAFYYRKEEHVIRMQHPMMFRTY